MQSNCKSYSFRESACYLPLTVCYFGLLSADTLCL